ncbi:Variant-specific surface protein [Giardia duodenalis]|uniref:Variant-specific surface protein n=1 Tax=Giardia intestinalis TaxID=5741 RepID=V6TPB7_GIAIN|nr:Variant-specific surface protein [Giardia intestinalis]
MLLAIYFAVCALADACKTDGTAKNNCVADQCDTVDETEICMQCAKTHVPINGACVTAADNDKCKNTNGSDDADQTCKTCLLQTFMYKGRCYETTAPPGSVMCKTADAGKCTEAAETKEYFVPPEATNAKDSVVWCGDATGVQAGTGRDKKYNGVVNCKTCDGSALQAENAGTAKCSSCQEGFFGTNLGADGATCTACGDDNCATCAATGKNQCSKCKATNTAGAKLYLKTASSGSTGTCVEASGCGAGFFPKDDAESGNKCVSCNDATDGVTDCAECTAPGEGKAKPTCTKCTDKYLKTAADGTTTCVEQSECTSDSFPVTNAQTGNKCVSCGDETGVTDASNAKWNGVANCTKCTQPSAAGTAKCTACASGFNLEGGACVSAGGVNLSTGAIAGISVAVIAVVGGLVGFLCWWFVCRGKA